VVGCSFVSRVQPRDNTRHVILGTQVYKPGEYAAQINLNWPNAWGIVKALIEKCMALPEGTYLIVKDPAKVRRRAVRGVSAHPGISERKANTVVLCRRA